MSKEEVRHPKNRTKTSVTAYFSQSGLKFVLRELGQTVFARSFGRVWEDAGG